MHQILGTHMNDWKASKTGAPNPWNTYERSITPNWCLKTSIQTIPAVGVVQEHVGTCRIAIYEFSCEHNRWSAGFTWLHSGIVQKFCLSSAFFCVYDNKSQFVARTLHPGCEVASDVSHTYDRIARLAIWRSLMCWCESRLHQNLPPNILMIWFLGILMFANESLLNDAVVISWSLTCADRAHGSDELIKSLTI